MGSAARDYAVLALAFAALQLPFLGQALVIDDGNFVDQALQILKQPGAPYSFAVHFNQPFDFFHYFANPPGLAYFQAAAIAAFGSSELALHAASLLFSGLAVASMYALSERLAGRGLLGALLLLATPAFLVSSHTLMADVPSAAFYSLAIFCFVRGLDRDEASLSALAGVAAGAAALLKYSGLSVVALIALYAALRSRSGASRRPGLHAGIAMAIAIAIFSIWCLASQLVYGELHFLAAGALESRPQSWLDQLRQALAALADLGGATIFAPLLLGWSLAACFALGRAAGIVALALAAVVAAPALLPESLSLFDASVVAYSAMNRLLLALLLSAGASTLVFCAAMGIAALRVLATSRPAPDRAHDAAVDLLLVAWLLGFVFLDARLLFATPKYLVSAVAPLILLLLRARVPGLSGRVWNGVAVATTAATGLLLSVASAEHGGSQRRFVVETVPEIARERPVWFTGHHAIRYYADKAGQRSLPERLSAAAMPKPGDVVYVVRGASKHAVPPQLRPRLTQIAEVSASSPLPVVMNNLRLGAGWWAHGAVPLPYAFSSAPHSTLLVFELEP